MGLHTDYHLWHCPETLFFLIIFVIPDKQGAPSISTLAITDRMFLTQLNLAGGWEVKERKLSPSPIYCHISNEKMYITTISLQQCQNHHYHFYHLCQVITFTTITTSSTITVSLLPTITSTITPSSLWQPPSSFSNHHPPLHNHCHCGQYHISPFNSRFREECGSGDRFQVYEVLPALPCLHLYPSLKVYIPLTNSIFICHSKEIVQIWIIL